MDRNLPLYGHDVLYGGPPFVHQFSHAWIDFRGIQDRFMHEKRCDYFENSRRAIEVQREYARRNPLGFAGYDEHCWGLTACDGPIQPMPQTHGRHRLLGYAARGVPYGPDDGTVSGSAALAARSLSWPTCAPGSTTCDGSRRYSRNWSSAAVRAGGPYALTTPAMARSRSDIRPATRRSRWDHPPLPSRR